jgi:sRNA-binding regulator protein Hfq
MNMTTENDYFNDLINCETTLQINFMERTHIVGKLLNYDDICIIVKSNHTGATPVLLYKHAIISIHEH